MPRCPTCRAWLDSDRERLGSRCPKCREPLYERPVRVRQEAEDGEGHCLAHPDNVASGTCQRCGNFLCAVCRTRWRGQRLCLACVERALASRAASPEEERAHYLQALWSLICGLGGWAVGLLGVVLIVMAVSGGPENSRFVAVVPGVLLLVGAPAFLIPGLGLGAAAIRTRGDHLILATAGLVLSALMAGAIIGMICLSAWRN